MVYICIYVYMYESMKVYRSICIDVCIYICTYVYKYISIYTYMYLCMKVCRYPRNLSLGV